MKKFVAIVILVAIMVVSGFAMAEEANTNEEYVKTTIGDVFSVIGKFNVDAADTVSDFAVGVANDVAEFGINTWNGTVETAKDVGNWFSATWSDIFNKDESEVSSDVDVESMSEYEYHMHSEMFNV